MTLPVNLSRPGAGPGASLLALALACALAGSGQALAQSRAGERPDGRPGGFATTVHPASPRRSDGDAEEPPPATTWEAQTSRADGEINPSEAADDDRPRLRLGRRPPVDGDMSWPPEPPPVHDGILETGEPVVTADGIDPGQLDTREPEEAAPFERPPAGFDPAAFAIELEPILDRRPARLARFEPFAPVGVRVGSFLVLPEAEIAFAAYDNLFRTSTDPRRDIALDVRPMVRAISAWRQHAVELRATGLTTFHNEFPHEDDRAVTLEARGRLDVTRRTNIEALASFDRAQEARDSINAVGGTGGRTEYDTVKAQLTFNHRFNRLALQLRGSVVEADFAPVVTGAGTLESNAFRDNALREGALRATWSFRPGLALFGEVALNSRDYHAAPADGILRDSTGERVRLGISFGTTSRILQGEVALGHARQTFDDSRLAPVDGIILDANLAWRVSGHTSLLFAARSDVSESTLAGSGGALSQTAGLEVRHAFRRHLIGTAGLTFARQDYEGVKLTEHSLTSLLGLEYYLNREVTLFGRYQHVDFDSTNAARNYAADEVRVGVRLRR